MNVQAFKLITGEDIIADLESESETEFVLSNPLGIAVMRNPQTGQPQIGFAPFPIHGQEDPQKTMMFSKKHVVYSYTPGDDFVHNYDKIFGAGLIVPKAKQILVG